jgi:hypothetical protein
MAHQLPQLVCLQFSTPLHRYKQVRTCAQQTPRARRSGTPSAGLPLLLLLRKGLQPGEQLLPLRIAAEAVLHGLRRQLNQLAPVEAKRGRGDGVLARQRRAKRGCMQAASAHSGTERSSSSRSSTATSSAG